MMIPGTYTVHWCGGSQNNVRDVRRAMKLARAKSGTRSATSTCRGSYVVRAGEGNRATAVAECREKSCTPFTPMSQRERAEVQRHAWTPAKATAAFKQRRGLSGAKRRKRRRR